MAGLRAVIPADAVPPPIDMQKGFDAPALRLLEAWRRSRRIVIHVRHDSVEVGSAFAPGLPGAALREGYFPAAGRGLGDEERRRRIHRRRPRSTAVQAGSDDDRRVRPDDRPVVWTTARVGASIGDRIIAAADACAAFDRPSLDGAIIPAARVHAVHLATLANELAEVARAEDVIAGLGRV